MQVLTTVHKVIHWIIYLSSSECSILFLQVVEKPPMINMLFCWYKQLTSCNRAIGKISNVFTLRWLILAGPVRYMKRKANQKFFSKRKMHFEIPKIRALQKLPVRYIVSILSNALHIHLFIINVQNLKNDYNGHSLLS